MEINLSQVIFSGIVSGITAGITAIFTTIAGFFVMRYFPKAWEKIEGGVKATLNRENMAKKDE
jgi:hypothetical protein